MSNSILVTLELDDKTREQLDGIGKKLDAILEVLQTGAVPTPLKSFENRPQEAVKEAVEETPTEELEKPESAEIQKKSIGLEDVQKKVVELAAAGKKSQVREIVNEYAARVSAIPADKVAEVWDRLTALEG